MDLSRVLALAMMTDQSEVSELSGRKESNCVRCRNHGLKIVLRGHKQYCPYAACTCDKCRFTAEQQRQMRLQNAIRRAEANDRNGTPSRRQRNSNVAPAMISPQQQQIQHQQQQQPIQQQPQPTSLPPQQVHHQQIIVTTVASTQPDQRNGGTPPGIRSRFFFLFANKKLVLNFFSSLLVFCAGKRNRWQENFVRLQQWTPEKIQISLGDDAGDVCAVKVRQRKHGRGFAENWRRFVLSILSCLSTKSFFDFRPICCQRADSTSNTQHVLRSRSEQSSHGAGHSWMRINLPFPLKPPKNNSWDIFEYNLFLKRNRAEIDGKSSYFFEKRKFSHEKKSSEITNVSYWWES
jgi:hypothetical protein